MGAVGIPPQTTRETTAARAGRTPAAGELVYDTNLGTLWEGDGATAGGVPTAVSLPGPVVNLLDPPYGVVAGDSGNQNAGFALAIAAAVAAGRPLYVPAGTYAITGTLNLTSNTVILGEKGLSKLHFTATETGQKAFVVAGNPTAVANVKLNGLTVYSNNVAVAGNTVTTFGVYVDNNATTDNADIEVSDCEFYHFESSAITSNNSGYTNRQLFARNRVHDIGTATMASATVATGINPGQSRDTVIDGNVIWGIGLDSLDHSVYASRTTRGCRVTNNTFVGSGVQFFGVPAYGVTISDNTFRGMGSVDDAVIVSATQGFTISGNQIGITGGSRRGIHVIGSSANGTVTGNTVDSTGVTRTAASIDVDSCSHVSVSANTVRSGPGGPGLVLLSSSDILKGVAVSGNTFLGESTAADAIWVNVGNNAASDLTVTGNTASGHRYGFNVTYGGSVTTVSRVVISGNVLLGSEGIRASALTTSVVVGNWSAYTTLTNCVNSHASGNVGDMAVTASSSVVTGDNWSTAPVAVQSSGATIGGGMGTNSRFALSHGSATDVTGVAGGGYGRKTVIFTTGNVTLKHSSTFVLKGAVDVTPAAGSVMTFESLSAGAYHEVSRNF